MVIGERIRVMREALGWSLARLALETQISASALSLIENGKRVPRVDTLAKIAHGLGIPVDLLLDSYQRENNLAADEQILQELTELMQSRAAGKPLGRDEYMQLSKLRVFLRSLREERHGKT